MSRISEFEPRRTEERRSARQHWPGSAWFAVGTMVVLNLILIAFIVRSELGKFEPAEVPPSANIDAPKVEPQREAQPLGNLAPDQGSKPEAEEPDATAAGTPKSADSNLEPQSLYSRPGPTPARPVDRSRAGRGQPAAVATRERWETPRHYNTEPVPQARFAAPQSPASRAPSPVPAAVAAPVPAPSSGSMPTPSMVASVRTPAVGSQNNGDTHQQQIAPTSTTAKKTQPVINPNPDSAKKAETRVASVRLPGMVKGWVPPKMAADSSSPKIQIVRRPPEPKANIPNCGGDVVIPCPTLKKRPLGGAPEGDRW